jgi:hypothetical protein
VSVDGNFSAESSFLFLSVEPGLQANSEIKANTKAAILIILQSKYA